MPGAGELDDRVTFYSPTATTDDLRGQEVEYTTVVATVWGQWRSISGRERLQAAAMDVVPEFRVTIYHRTDITVQMRASRLDGTEGMCQVVAVTPVENRRFLDVDLVRVL
jgi:SPP1 family predicted phage head-tail adaptor